MTTTTKKTFEQVYADTVIADMTNEQWEEAAKQRQLTWHGEKMPLSEAAELYAKISDGYNNFEPDMLAKLQAEFPDAGIEATPARESSPAVYLHIPACRRSTLHTAVVTFVETNFCASEVDVMTKFVTPQGNETLDGEALRIWWD